MLFKEKLEALKAKELKEKACLEGERRREEWERKRREEELDKLAEITRKKFSSAFEVVNDIYLEKKGKILLKKLDRGDRLEVNLELNWDWHPDRGGGVSGKRLCLKLGNDLDVELKGASDKSPIVQFSLNDENWRQQFEDGVYLILSSPFACGWHEPHNPWI